MLERPSAPKNDRPLPVCKAILLCERAIEEAGTGRYSLIGIIRQLTFPQLPAPSQPMTAYLQLVGGVGRYDISVEVMDRTTDQSLATARGRTLEFHDRLAVIPFVFALPPLPLCHAGCYGVIVFADGREIDRQKFTVACAPHRDGASAR